MRLHRFYIAEKILTKKLCIKDESLIHQWRNVFRYNVGREVVLFDGSGFEYDCVILKLSNREAELNVVSKKKGVMPEREITLYQSLIKKDKMEWVVEKATELGVSKIVPIISDRSEKKGFNLARAKKIAIEASEQCGRGDVPEIGEVMNYELGIMNHGENIIVLDPSGVPLHNSYVVPHNSFSLFIGPEGGWSEKELNLFKQKNAEILSLGKLTLRAETAAITSIAKLNIWPDQAKC